MNDCFFFYLRYEKRFGVWGLKSGKRKVEKVYGLWKTRIFAD